MPVTGCKKTGSTLFAASPNEFSLFLQPACHFLTRSTTPHRRIVVRRWHFNALHNHLYPSQTAAEEAFDVAETARDEFKKACERQPPRSDSKLP